MGVAVRPTRISDGMGSVLQMAITLFALVSSVTARKDCEFISTVNVTLQRIDLTCRCDISKGDSDRMKLQRVHIQRHQNSRSFPLQSARSSKPVEDSRTMVTKKTYRYAFANLGLHANDTLKFRCDVYAFGHDSKPEDSYLQKEINLLDLFTDILTTTTTRATKSTSLRTTTASTTTYVTTSQAVTTVPATITTTTTTTIMGELLITRTRPVGLPTPRPDLTTARQQQPGAAQEEQSRDLLDEAFAEGITIKMLVIIVVFSVLFVNIIIIAVLVARRTRGKQKRNYPPPPPPCTSAKNLVPLDVISQLLTAVTGDHRQAGPAVYPDQTADYCSPSIYRPNESQYTVVLNDFEFDTAAYSAGAQQNHGDRHDTGRKCFNGNENMMSDDDVNAVERDTSTMGRSLQFQDRPLLQNCAAEQPFMTVGKYHHRELPSLPVDNFPRFPAEARVDTGPGHFLPSEEVPLYEIPVPRVSPAAHEQSSDPTYITPV